MKSKALDDDGRLWVEMVRQYRLQVREGFVCRLQGGDQAPQNPIRLWSNDAEKRGSFLLRSFYAVCFQKLMQTFGIEGPLLILFIKFTNVADPQCHFVPRRQMS
jgi:hypothetical protein